MKQSSLMDAHVLMKRINNLLNETMDLSRQLAEALDRSDQVTVQMLISMRAEPVGKLKTTDQALREQLKTLAPEERERLAALLNGAAAEKPEEQALADQVGSNTRLLKQVQELDRVLSLRLSRDKSVYK